MSKVLATGIIENLNLYSPEGKTYKLADLSVGGVAFKGIYKKPMGLTNGQNVEVVEHPAAAGKKFGEKEIRAVAGAVPVATTQATTETKSTGFGRNPQEQDKISRQWALTQSIAFISLLADKGGLPAKIFADKTGTLQTQLVGQYANLWFNAVQTGASFDKLAAFTGQVNEASEATEDEIPA